MYNTPNTTQKKEKNLQKNKSPLPYSPDTPKNQSHTGESLVKNPFAKTSKLIRSPTLNSSKTHSQFNLGETSRKTVNDVSQVKENEYDITSIIERLDMFEKMCADLKKQVDDLTIENQRLKKSLMENEKMLPMEIETIPVTEEFCTDEEELAYEINKETDWILKKGKKKNPKKRKAESSPDLDISDKSPEKLKVSGNKSNGKGVLKNPKLPPIILSNISDFNKVQELMTLQSIKYEIKLLNNDQLSIKVFSEEDYRKLTKAINEAKFEWHSYENKATRPCKVIARGLHPTCNTEYIVDDLKQQGLKILSAVNLTKKKKINDKQVIEPLPLFMLTFDHNEDVKKVFSIVHIVHTKVKIEAMRKQTEQIAQCKRCQRYGHTQSFCNREARCVKCAGSHLTFECKLDNKVPPKCSNCNEAHPANYRGCMVAKELQKRRAANKKVDATKAKQHKLPTSKPSLKNGSYSDVVRKSKSGAASKETPCMHDPQTCPSIRLNTPLGKKREVRKKFLQVPCKSTHGSACNQSPSPCPSDPCGCQPKKKVTPLGNNNRKNQKSPNKGNEELLVSSLERLIAKMDVISARLERIEDQNANRQNGTSRSILINE
jgi:hypothetical protein